MIGLLEYRDLLTRILVRDLPRLSRKGHTPMPTLLAKNADVLVTMDEERRELLNAGLFARDGIIEQVGPTDQLPPAPRSMR